MNKMNKKQLMRFITEVSFAMDDIALYLDLHPSCKHALSSYENYPEHEAAGCEGLHQSVWSAQQISGKR